MNPFYDRWTAWRKANGGRFNYSIATNPEPEDKQRAEKAKRLWLYYLESNGYKATASTWRNIWAGAGKGVTVPCEKPELFDPTFEYPSDAWQDISHPSRVSRSAVSSAVDRARIAARAYKPESRGPTPPEHLREPVDAPFDWMRGAEEDRPPIPVLSDQLRSKLGLQPEKREEDAA
jgi:hypothetical protein